MSDADIIRKFAHLQISVTVALKIGRIKATVNGYSHLIDTKELMQPHHDDYLDKPIREALRHCAGTMRDKFPALTSGAIKTATGTLHTVNLLFRKFVTTRRVNFGITKESFRELYDAYKAAYGRDAKANLAQKFGIEKRSVENYLMGRIPKYEKFRTGITAMVTAKEYSRDYLFSFGNYRLEQSIYTDANGVIRNRITKPGETDLFRWDTPQFFDLLGEIVKGARNGEGIKWLMVIMASTKTSSRSGRRGKRHRRR